MLFEVDNRTSPEDSRVSSPELPEAMSQSWPRPGLAPNMRLSRVLDGERCLKAATHPALRSFGLWAPLIFAPPGTSCLFQTALAVGSVRWRLKCLIAFFDRG